MGKPLILDYSPKSLNLHVIFSSLISPFNCKTQADGSFTLWDDSSIICYEGDWLNIHFHVFVIFIIFYGILFVGLLCREFWKYRIRSDRDKVARADDESSRSFRYLSRSYKNWELVRILKRIAIIICGKLSFGGSTTSKYFAIFFFLLFFMLFDVVVFPYLHSSVMRLTLFWNAIALLIFVTDGLVFKSQEISDFAESFCAIGIIMIVIAGLIMSTYHLFRTRLLGFRSRVFTVEISQQQPSESSKIHAVRS